MGIDKMDLKAGSPSWFTLEQHYCNVHTFGSTFLLTAGRSIQYSTVPFVVDRRNGW